MRDGIDQRGAPMTRSDQIASARRDIRLACAVQGHELGGWYQGGVLVDDEAMCAHCGARVFVAYGKTSPTTSGLRVFGSAFERPCWRRRSSISQSISPMHESE
jgi:hypothetical protein